MTLSAGRLCPTQIGPGWFSTNATMQPNKQIIIEDGKKRHQEPPRMGWKLSRKNPAVATSCPWTDDAATSSSPLHSQGVRGFISLSEPGLRFRLKGLFGGSIASWNCIGTLHGEHLYNNPSPFWMHLFTTSLVVHCFFLSAKDIIGNGG